VTHFPPYSEFEPEKRFPILSFCAIVHQGY
jgi:hypothetical protein